MDPCRPSGRFSARDRIRRRAEYQQIQNAGRRVVSSSFVFLVQRAQGDDGPRLGVTASRRVGHAPARNRAKRLVREAFRVVRSEWPPNAEVVVIVRGPLGARSLSEVVAEWRSAQGRIRRALAQAPVKTHVESEPSETTTTPLAPKKSC